MSGAARAVLAVVAAATGGIVALGCGDDFTRAPAVLRAGELEVRVLDAPARITVLRGGAVVWESLPGSDGDREAPGVLSAARTTQPVLDGVAGGVQMSFGSFRFGEDEDTPWRGVATLRQLTVGDDRVEFVVYDRGGDALGRGEVRLAADGGGGEVVIAFDQADAGHNRSSLAFACDPDEHFLGLGGQSWSIDHRGQTVALWVQEDGIGKFDTPDDVYEGIWALHGRRHSTHTPMPIMLSSRGWALAVDTSARAVFDLCDRDPAVARLESWEGAITAHLFVGDSPRDAVSRLTAWTGRPPIPPAFAFAPWLDALYGSANVRRVADALRDADVPVSAIWTEDWRGGNDEGGAAGGYVLEEDWRVDLDLYPDFEQLARDLHRDGYKFLTYSNTFLDIEADVFAEAVALGHTIDNAAGQPYLFTGVKFNDATLLDLSSPSAVAWAKDVYDDAIAIGSDGWMADFAEWLPTDAVLASGEDALLAHNRYAVEWAKLNYELLRDAQAADGVERIYFARAAHLGSQPYMQVLWAGDQQTDFSLGDGMPSVIPMGIGLGLTGFPYFGHDIAGYMSQATVPVTRDLWFRWVTFGALSPVMRTHHGRSARDNWNWESDAASTLHLARWARLHMQLVPYQRAMAAEARATGVPLFRPFVLDWPEWAPGWTLDDQYVLGDRIAVAPTMVEGATERTLRLPAGTWYGLLDGRALVSDGAAAVRVTTGLEDIAALVPDCTLLALYPPELDTVVAATGPVTDLEAVADDRELWLYPCTTAAPSRVRDLTELGGGLTYTRTAVAFDPAAATWNGAPVTFTEDGPWAVADVIGPGTLAIDGAELARAVGGAADRRIRIRVALP